MSTPEDTAISPSMSELHYLWEEYKYRHQLCWSAIYQVTIAVLVLAVVPYTKDSLTALLKYWMLVPPAIGAVFALFGIFLVRNELALFAKVKLAYHTLRDKFLDRIVTDQKSRDKVRSGIIPETMRRTAFDIYVFLFMGGITVLSFANVFFLACWWIPSR